MADEKIEVENINCPGHVTRLDAKKYSAMKKVLLKILPKKKPGLTQAEMLVVILPYLPQDIWPNGEKSGW